MKKKLFTIIDCYIIGKFIGAYIFTIALIIAITVMIDFDAKIDSFIKTSPPVHAIVFDYYLCFIPYFINLFSPLFVFIAVIFFTSKLADNSEIIAMMASGLNIARLVRPYLLSAAMISLCTFLLNSYVIPPANVKRIHFENTYIKNKKVDYATNIQLEVTTGIVAHFGSFDNATHKGRDFSLDRFDGKKLVSRLTAKNIVWNWADHWTIKDYMIREFIGMREHISRGEQIDTTLAIVPSDFIISVNDSEQLTTPRLKAYIDRQKKRGIGNIQLFEIEYHKRFAMTFAAFILTIIGISLSSRKIKGGMGLNIGFGLLLSFSYILFMQISSSLAIAGIVTPFVAVWIPNFLYTGIAVYLYGKAPR
ncbi:MAG: LptF/LptG family permease [Dysgonamonadaceae bacterium]|jgi:lipopolysaccharide export system permease protein|nr:LptF/LptG family permease [Dysgonamonadaceae bacterium]